MYHAKYACIVYKYVWNNFEDQNKSLNHALSVLET